MPTTTSSKAGIIFAAVALFSGTAQATTFYSSSQRALGYNAIDDPFSLFGSDFAPQGYDARADGSTAASSFAGSRQFDGLDADGNPASMTVEFDAAGSAASGGVLKSRTSASISTPFYNIDLNDPFVVDTDFNTDPNGVPEEISVSSEVHYQDTVNVSGDASLSSIVLSLGLDGSIGGDGFITNGEVILAQRTPVSDQLFYGTVEGSVDTVIESNPIAVVDGLADITLELWTGVNFYLSTVGPFGEGPLALMEGSADFFNTLNILQISGFDASGNPVDLASATDSGGFSFVTTRVDTPTDPGGKVPAPPVLMLLCLGLGLLLRVRRNS